MDNNRIDNSTSIDLEKVFRILWGKKVAFIKIWIITFALSCFYILPKPRAYDAQVMLAPEASSSASAGGLSSIASSFGVNLDGVGGGDAIFPELYPDLMQSNDFIISLLETPVTTIDGDVSCTLQTFLQKHQKSAFYTKPFKWVKKQIKKLTSKPAAPSAPGHKIDPFKMTREEMGLVKLMKNCISCYYNKKTGVITIKMRSQDPMVSATVAEAARIKLQDFIIDYRTRKAKVDVEYYEKLEKDAKKAYDIAVAKYSSYCDSHNDAFLQSAISERDKLENELSLKQTTLQTMETQLLASQAKLQERTPAFTTLQGASVPVKASSPKRMLFVAFMLFLVTACMSTWYARDEMKKVFVAR